MNNRKLLMAFLTVFTSSVALADTINTLAVLKRDLPTYSAITIWCKETCTADCNLIATHLDNARKLALEKYNINQLDSELKNVKDPICKKPIEDDLKKAIEKCPNFEKLYWDTLSPEDQSKIATAVATLVRNNNGVAVYASVLNVVHGALKS